jgi:cell wall-associated NlpC family hydrolase
MLLLIVGPMGCAAASPGWGDERFVLHGEAVGHPIHAALSPTARLLPEAARGPRYAVAEQPTIVRQRPVDAEGTRDNLTQLDVGEPVWVLEARGDALLIRTGDGYLGHIDAAAVRTVDAGEFGRILRNATSPEADPIIEQAVAHAQSWLGTPYLWGGRSQEGVDCSGLTQTAYAAAGVHLPRDSDQQALVGRLVATRYHTAGLVRGDLLFFLSPRTGRVNHVALYLGNNDLVESVGQGVQRTSLDPTAPNYIGDDRLARFSHARRIVD